MTKKMGTRQRILIAVASGCVNTRQIAQYLGLSHNIVKNYFYNGFTDIELFENGDLVQWVPGKANTLRLGPNAAITRDRGRVVAVGRIERIEQKQLLNKEQKHGKK